jgi:transcriptional regulator with XRE-family HTH domain
VILLLHEVVIILSWHPSEEVSRVSMGPTVRRRRLGSELRRLREPKFKLEAVAEELGVAPSTLSRIETGKAPTKTIYLMKMLDMYGVDDPAQRQVLIDMAREGHRKGWWAEYDDVLPTGFGIYVGLETEAAGLRTYVADAVHGLLQTADYARTVLREVNARDSDEQIQRLVSLRLARQDVLNQDRPIDLWVIHDESVIRRAIGGTAVMRAQLEHMIEAASWPGVTLQVLPFGSGAHAGLSGPFSILEFPERTDPEVAYVESVAGVLYLEKQKEVRACIEAFDRLRAQALSPAASTDLIAGALKDV